MARRYRDASRGAFNTQRRDPVKHTRKIHLTKPGRYPENNKVERLNGTLRERQAVMRGLKKPDGPLTKGHAYYNLIRPHQALDGRIPAEVAGITVAGKKDRWSAIIREASERNRETAALE